MAENYNLYKCNLANTCQYEDSDLVYPKTIAQQVIVQQADETHTEQTLAAWISTIPSLIESATGSIVNVESEYPTRNENNFYLGLIKDVNFNIPKIKNTEGGVIQEGIPKIHTGYFSIDTSEAHKDELKFELKYHYGYNEIYYPSLKIGDIRSIDNTVLCEIDMPKPSVSFRIDNEGQKIDIQVSIGNFSTSSSIPVSNLQTILGVSSWYLNINNDTLSIANDSTQSSSSIELPTYNGIDAGFVPANPSNCNDKFLKSNGSWVDIPWADIPWSNMPSATSNNIGGVKTNYTAQGYTNYPVLTDNNNDAYVPIVNYVLVTQAQAETLGLTSDNWIKTQLTGYVIVDMKLLLNQ